MDFYVLVFAGYSSGYASLEQVEPITRGKWKRCSVCNKAILLESFPPYNFQLEHGRKVGDFSSVMGGICVTERVKNAYLSEGLKGIEEFIPIKLVSHKKKPSDDSLSFFWIRISESTTKFNEEASGIVWNGKVHPVCRHGEMLENCDGLVVNDQTWDGLDIFIPTAFPYVKIVSTKFIDWISRNGFTNIGYVLTKDFSCRKDDYSLAQFSEEFLWNAFRMGRPPKKQKKRIFKVIGVYKINLTKESMIEAARYYGFDSRITKNGDLVDEDDFGPFDELRLVEIQVPEDFSRDELASIGQGDDWHLSWLEFFLDKTGTRLLSDKEADEKKERRLCFYIHYINPKQPLKIGSDEIKLPPASELPDRLKPFIHYIPPED